MSTIRATCPTCGCPVDLEPAQVLLLTRPETTTAGTYLFVCAACDQVAVKAARPADITLLICAGVVPAERTGQSDTFARPSGHQPHARPFTWDDLLDLHLLLGTDDWPAKLHAADRPVA